MTAEELGLSRRRAQELALHTAWLEVAGDALARRAKPIRIARGVLELVVEDERWLESLRGLVPRLAGRLSARHPKLGVNRFRLRLGEAQAEAPVAILPVDEEPSPSTERLPEESERPVEGEGSQVERLERLSARYLQRSSPR